MMCNLILLIGITFSFKNTLKANLNKLTIIELAFNLIILKKSKILIKLDIIKTDITNTKYTWYVQQ